MNIYYVIYTDYDGNLTNWAADHIEGEQGLNRLFEIKAYIMKNTCRPEVFKILIWDKKHEKDMRLLLQDLTRDIIIK